MRWGIPGVSMSTAPQRKNTCVSLHAYFRALAQGFLAGRKGNPGTVFHPSWLLLLKRGAARIRAGTEESTRGSTNLSLPTSPVVSNLTIAVVPSVVQWSSSHISRYYKGRDVSGMYRNMNQDSFFSFFSGKSYQDPNHCGADTHGRKGDLQPGAAQPVACRNKCKERLLDVSCLLTQELSRAVWTVLSA